MVETINIVDEGQSEADIEVEHGDVVGYTPSEGDMPAHYKVLSDESDDE